MGEDRVEMVKSVLVSAGIPAALAAEPPSFEPFLLEYGYPDAHELPTRAGAEPRSRRRRRVPPHGA
jgi:hypothetical protein